MITYGNLHVNLSIFHLCSVNFIRKRTGSTREAVRDGIAIGNSIHTRVVSPHKSCSVVVPSILIYILPFLEKFGPFFQFIGIEILFIKELDLFIDFVPVSEHIIIICHTTEQPRKKYAAEIPSVVPTLVCTGRSSHRCHPFCCARLVFVLPLTVFCIMDRIVYVRQKFVPELIRRSNLNVKQFFLCKIPSFIIHCINLCLCFCLRISILQHIFSYINERVIIRR